MALSRGARLGPYEILEPLGAGGMGEVYRAKDSRTRAQVLRLILRDGVLVVTGGLVAGLIAALTLAQTLTGLLHDVQPADPVALASVGAILSSAGLVAAYLPARKATRVSPLDTLRNQ